MEKLERSPLFVLDGIRRLAERIECDVPRADAESQPLAMALLDVRWLHQKTVWFPEQAHLQERLRHLGNHLRALACRVGERGRVEALRRCHDELARLRGPRCFGRFASSEFENQL
ncbi:MAG: hypothetical protein ACK501_05895 [Planctomycetota bacterium]|jgi:hypothetical protein